MDKINPKLLLDVRRWSDVTENRVGNEIEVEGFDFGRTTLLENLPTKAQITFHECTFPTGFKFKNCLFEGNLEFMNCVLQGDFAITGGRANANISFIDSKVGGNLLVAPHALNMVLTISRGTTIAGNLEIHARQDPFQSLWLENIVISKSLDIKGNCKEISLDESRIGHSARFSLPQVDSLDISNVKIGKNLTISELSNIGELIGNDCVVAGEFRARNVFFLRKISLTGGSFGGKADFSADEEKRLPEVNFANRTFNGTAKFQNRKFTDETVFDYCLFKVPPAFHNSSLSSDTSFQETRFEGHNSPLAENRFRSLRACMADAGSHLEELRFFADEQLAKRLSEKQPFSRFLFWTYEWSSGYGRLIFRPLMIFVSLQIIFGAMYFGLFNVQNFICKDVNTCYKNVDAAQVVDFTLVQSLPFVSAIKDFPQQEPADKTKNSVSQVWKTMSTRYTAHFLAVVQTALSLATLFLAGLGIRNLFRLK